MSSDGDLPPYVEETRCPKCGWFGSPSTKYMEFGRCVHSASVVVGYDKNERLHRECGRCSYSWDEALADV